MIDDRQQLNLLKRQFDELVRNEPASSIDDMLDDATIRRRFSETLSELITANSTAPKTGED
jgi:hypothetical protein